MTNSISSIFVIDIRSLELNTHGGGKTTPQISHSDRTCPSISCTCVLHGLIEPFLEAADIIRYLG